MSLSEQEQRALREIEQALMADDPKFGKAVASNNGLAGGGFTLRGIALFVLGLVLSCCRRRIKPANIVVRCARNYRILSHVRIGSVDAARGRLQQNLRHIPHFQCEESPTGQFHHWGQNGRKLPSTIRGQ